LITTAPETVDRIAGALERLGVVADRQDRRPAPTRQRTVKVRRSSYEPWWGQRMLHRPEAVELRPGLRTPRLHVHLARCRVVIAGRQSGKTEAAAAELLRVMLERPGSFSVLLAPNYRIAQAAIRKVIERIAAELPGMWTWKEQKKELHLTNGSIWAVFSADRKESVRGPTVDGLLWVDEGAFLHVDAWTAALGALGAVQHPLILITTTPVGKNWAHREFTDKANRRLRFRTADSPFHSKYTLEKNRRSMSEAKFAQEHEAVFVDSLTMVFPLEVRERMWVDGFPRHEEAAENTLGVDLAKHQDWTVITVINQWGEAEFLERVQKLDYPLIVDLIAEHAERLEALVVLDRGGAGGGPGEVVHDYLKRDHEQLDLLLVNTGSDRMKMRVVEQLQGDAQWDRVHVRKNHHTEQADKELEEFRGIQFVSRGETHTRYEGPQVKGKFDDCPISLGLANWGRLHGERREHEQEDLAQYSAKSVPSSRITHHGTQQGGYRTRLPRR